MLVNVQPGFPLKGTINGEPGFCLPGDKSISHRASLFAALADGVSEIDNFLVSGVTRAMLNALRNLGLKWEITGSVLRVEGKGLAGLSSPSGPLNCGNSATTMRMLAGALVAGGVPAVLDGTPGLRRRPMGRIVEPLQAMGAPVETSPEGTAPIKLNRRSLEKPLKAIEYQLPVASAQVKSCLLLAALGADGTTVLHEPGPSRDHTERMLSAMGVTLTKDIIMEGESQSKYTTAITPPSHLRLRPLKMTLPGDLSAAAFLIIAALITPGSEITIEGIGMNPTRTGLLDALELMGADFEITNPRDVSGEPAGDLTVRYSQLKGVKVEGQRVVRMIDEFPAFAVAAAHASGRTVVADACELRLKESDRIADLCREMSNLGVSITETADGFIIDGGKPLTGGQTQPHGDHRLAMSMIVAGLAAKDGVIVEGAEIVEESFPNFIETLQNLGAQIRMKV